MILAVVNQKGGVGKTTTAVNLSHGIALATLEPVLLIDLDPQGNCADSLGIESGNDVVQWLLGYGYHAEVARPNLYVLRSDKKTTQLKAAMTGMVNPAQIIARQIEEDRLTRRFQNIVIDCAPSSDLLHIAALMAADYCLIPTWLDQLSIKGVVELLSTLASLRQMGALIKPWGILPTFYEWVTTETHEQITNLTQSFPSLMLPVIPRDTACRRASRAGKTLWEMRPTPRALETRDSGRLIGGYELVMQRLKGIL